jgi:hypothetical protein
VPAREDCTDTDYKLAPAGQLMNIIGFKSLKKWLESLIFRIVGPFSTFCTMQSSIQDY